MKKAIAFATFFIVACILLNEVNQSGHLASAQTDSASVRLTQQVDSLIAANKLKFDTWNLHPVFSKTWVNGESRDEAYLKADFVSSDNETPLNSDQLHTFGAQLTAMLKADLKDQIAFDKLCLRFESSENFLIFKSSSFTELTYLLGKQGQSVATSL